ncbi:hypothetical protein CRUP_017895 [Coryphaenoides rupestris]|nr:hypothetical protein CRUP_017895 [Coryphaenoides rupestris]
MGSGGSSSSPSRSVSFGLDEAEKVTVIEGVKLSDDVLRRMREAQASEGKRPPPHTPDHQKPPPIAEMQEEMLKKFEQEQAQVQEQLARLAQREKERHSAAAAAAAAGGGGLAEVPSSLIMEQGKAHEEQEKAKILPAELDAWNLDNYKQTSEQYTQAATKAESHIRAPRSTTAESTTLGKHEGGVREAEKKKHVLPVHASRCVSPLMLKPTPPPPPPLGYLECISLAELAPPEGVIQRKERVAQRPSQET